MSKNYEQLGAQSPKTEKNSHWWTEEGLIKDLSLFKKVYPETFQKKKNILGTILVFLFLAIAIAILIKPGLLYEVTNMLKVSIPHFSALIIRIVAGVFLGILLVGTLLSSTAWINKKTGGKINSKLIFHRITQGRYDRDEIIALFNERAFDKILNLEEDEGSNMYINLEEDKKGKTYYIFLGEYDDYCPVPLAEVAIVSGEEYDSLKKTVKKL